MLAAFAAGLLVCALIWQAVLLFGGLALVDADTLKSQEKELAALRAENDELFDDLFSPEIAEQYLRQQLAVRELRVRLEANDLARIEVPLAALPQFANKETRQRVAAHLRLRARDR